MHGGVARDDLGEENLAALGKGLENLAQHVENVRSYGVPLVVAINRFSADTDAEVELVENACAERGVKAVMCTHWADGSAGTEELANAIVEAAESGEANFSPLYPDDMPLWEKIRTIAQKIYRADDITGDKRVQDQLTDLERNGMGSYPVCIAKTQYSFSADANLKGAPRGFTVPVREVRLSNGAGFIVAICGDIMTMPGLPRVPAANSIGLNADGMIEGLF
jgi:formate--tetrahydrofolate ligase